MKFAKNFLFNTDSYKVSMPKQYPPGTQYVRSYIESRGGMYDATVFFGLQMFLKEYMSVPVTTAMIDQAEAFYAIHGEPFDRTGWDLLVSRYAGVLPLQISAVPEGSVIPVSIPLVTIVNTDPDFYWLTTWAETAILRAVWYPTTVATQSHSIKRVIKEYLDETGDVAGLNFKLHDFGARGVSSLESAGIGGAAHLVNFMGTDTIVGVLTAMEYYNAPVCGFSIPASEHSTITSWGKNDEVRAYENMIKQFGKPGAIFAVVSDSYDIRAACKLWGGLLKKQVVDSGAMLVVRPDSGDPASIVLECVRILEQGFGSTVNDKHYKVLNNVRVIQGDGINESSIRGILLNLKMAGYSADNVAFGMGGALLQIVNRDTQKFAMKCSAACIDGEWTDVFKDPVTDQGKRSKKGRITTVARGSEYMAVLEADVEALVKLGFVEIMQPVWRNGILLKDYTFDEVRANAV